MGKLPVRYGYRYWPSPMIEVMIPFFILNTDTVLEALAHSPSQARIALENITGTGTRHCRTTHITTVSDNEKSLLHRNLVMMMTLKPENSRSTLHCTSIIFWKPVLEHSTQNCCMTSPAQESSLSPEILRYHNIILWWVGGAIVHAHALPYRKNSPS